MDSQKLKEKLIAYIKSADDKKIEAIYKFVGDEMERVYNWYEDETFVAELEVRDKSLESGEDKGYTIEEMSAFLNKRKAERYATQVQD
jgi:hypothetical protein